MASGRVRVQGRRAALCSNRANGGESDGPSVPSILSTAVALTAAASAVVLFSAGDQRSSSASAMASCEAAIENEKRKLNSSARGVMLHRTRSNRTRGLADKYNVDWDMCLGEGAYGSVHPARLAATGEKVS